MSKHTSRITPHKQSRRFFLRLGGAAAGLATLCGLKFLFDENRTEEPETPRVENASPTDHLFNLRDSIRGLPEIEIPHSDEIRRMLGNMKNAGADVNARESGNPHSPHPRDLINFHEKPTLLMSTVLDHAIDESIIRRDYFMVFTLALLDNGADINAVTKNGNTTALHIAVTQGDENMVGALLERKDINLSIADSEGYYAVDYAQDKVIEKLLLDRGAKHSEKYKTKPPAIHSIPESAPLKPPRTIA